MGSFFRHLGQRLEHAWPCIVINSKGAAAGSIGSARLQRRQAGFNTTQVEGSYISHEIIKKRATSLRGLVMALDQSTKEADKHNTIFHVSSKKKKKKKNYRQVPCCTLR
jgi:hypothetical protein